MTTKNQIDDLQSLTDSQILLNFARQAVEMAIQLEYYKTHTGEIAHHDQGLERNNKYGKFQPPLTQLENAIKEHRSSDAQKALQQIMRSIAELTQ
jgi:hypothetical protein